MYIDSSWPSWPMCTHVNGLPGSNFSPAASLPSGSKLSKYLTFLGVHI